MYNKKIKYPFKILRMINLGSLHGYLFIIQRKEYKYANTQEYWKIRKMYYEQYYTVTEITRILKISRNTCYKYLEFVNFNAYIKENKRIHYLDQYK